LNRWAVTTRACQREKAIAIRGTSPGGQIHPLAGYLTRALQGESRSRGLAMHLCLWCMSLVLRASEYRPYVIPLGDARGAVMRKASKSHQLRPPQSQSDLGQCLQARPSASLAGMARVSLGRPGPPSPEKSHHHVPGCGETSGMGERGNRFERRGGLAVVVKGLWWRWRSRCPERDGDDGVMPGLMLLIIRNS
jgi:hypothetical protein